MQDTHSFIDRWFDASTIDQFDIWDRILVFLLFVALLAGQTTLWTLGVTQGWERLSPETIDALPRLYGYLLYGPMALMAWPLVRGIWASEGTNGWRSRIAARIRGVIAGWA